MTNHSRRGFLRNVTVAAPAAGVLGAGVAASGEPIRHERRVVAGAPEAPFSRATIFGPFVFVAGVLGSKPGTREIPSGTFEAECVQALENLKASIESAGARTTEVMKCTCFLTDVGDFATFNKVFRAYFPSKPPARSTVVVKELVAPAARIEIDCVAVLQ